MPAKALLDFFCLRQICIDRDLLQRTHPHLQNPCHRFFSHCRCHSDRSLSHESSAPGKEIKGWKNLGVSVSSTIFLVQIRKKTITRFRIRIILLRFIYSRCHDLVKKERRKMYQVFSPLPNIGKNIGIVSQGRRKTMKKNMRDATM